MKISLTIITFFLSIIFSISNAQLADSLNPKESLNQNALFLEVFGNAPMASVNYERRILRKDIASLFVRAGIGLDVIDFKDDNLFIPSIPLETSIAFGKNKHFAELGIGITPFLSKFPTWSNYDYYYVADLDSFDYNMYFTGVARIGYRFESKRNWLVRIAFTPILYNSSDENDNYSTNFGVSVGKLF